MATTNETEPRALGAALSAPAFITRGHDIAMHAADRHVERWAPETTANRVRSMRSLGFVDRLVAPWIETAQRSASLRLFSQYAGTGAGERTPSTVSWVFPRPWYQDELDWMAAARQVHQHSRVTEEAAPSLLTTRGTFVAPAAPAAPSVGAPPVAMPSALYEYVAPSLSIAAPSSQSAAGPVAEAAWRSDAYSPLVSLDAVQAAHLMSRAVAPLASMRRDAGTAGAAAPTTVMTSGLRSVLASILERAAIAQADRPVSRLSMSAPELVTPPAPRGPDAEAPGGMGGAGQAARVAEQLAEQRAQVAELQRIAQASAQREQIAQAEEQARQQAGEAARGAATQARMVAETRAAAEARAVAEARAAQAASTNEAGAVAQAAELRAAAEARAATQAATARAQADAAASQPAAEPALTERAEPTVAPGSAPAELRAVAERAEAELRERIAIERANERTPEAQRQTAVQTDAERTRSASQVDAERVRVASRSGAPRLHEQARAEAAAHARSAIAPSAATTTSTIAAATTVAAAPRTAPAEVTAAIAGLPPELAAVIGSSLSQRPEQAMQMIAELGDALRTVELLARSSATGASFESTRGPRLVMPAGLGGLVSAVDHAQAIATRPAVLGGPRALAPLPQLVAPAAPASRAAPLASAARVPTLPWLSAPTAGAPSAASSAPSAAASTAPWAAMAPSTALGATASAAPAALAHVAWADRWLARFAGAAPASLDTLSAAAAAPELRMQALAHAAPGAVFVAPDFARGDLTPEQSRAAAAASRRAAAAVEPDSVSGVPAPRLINPQPSEAMRRFDDDAETPDDVFAAIAAATSRGRAAAARPAAAAAPSSTASSTTHPTVGPVAAANTAATAAVERMTLADITAHSAPTAPGAGLSAQLASSPFAPALRHVLPLPSAPRFDVRALFGGGLGATYLAGLLGAASREVEIGAQLAPVWASWSEPRLGRQLGGERADGLGIGERMVPGFDAAYVRPEGAASRAAETARSAPADTGDASAQSAAQHAAAQDPAAQVAAAQVAAAQNVAAQSAAASDAVAAARSIALAQAAEAAAAGVDVSATGFTAAEIAAAQRTAGIAAGAGVASAQADSLQSAQAAQNLQAAQAPLSTVRSALLSWDPGTASAYGSPFAAGAAGAFAGAPSGVPGTPGAFAGAPGVFGAGAFGLDVTRDSAATTARMMVGAMSWPMLADVAMDPSSVWASPGMIGERAHSWSVAQERSSTELSLDFVLPELVLAARVYGLGPAEAAQAARLAIAGASQLGAMASAVDRTFVEAMAIGRETKLREADRRQRAAVGRAPDAVEPGATSAETTASGAARPAPASRPTITTAFPMANGDVAAAVAPAPSVSSVAPVAAATSGAAFGVDRRAPRGAFLWPSATIAALGMTAAGSDGQFSTSVVALELLAAQVVAELGTYTALAEAEAIARGRAGERSLAAARGGAIMADRDALLDSDGADRRDAASGAFAGRSDAALTGRGDFALTGAQPSGADLLRPGAEPGEADVLGAASALVPASRRARFEALYVALGQSTTGRGWSPAARAARALAMAGRGDDTTISARERAATAWDVLPVVYLNETVGGGRITFDRDAAFGDLGGTAGAAAERAAGAAAAMSTHVSVGAGSRSAGSFGGLGSTIAATSRGGASRARGGSRDVVQGDSASDQDWVQASASPGLAGLSSRAGEALGSYVSPAAPPSAPRETGAMLRAPSAEPEYVRTGRSGGRYGGGEPEIPPWFEAAARKMFAEQTGSGDGISLADLTLVTSAPSSHIAASTRSAPSASPPAPSSVPAGQTANAAQIDVEKLANEVYRDILVLMDVARSRNGDPFL